MKKRNNNLIFMTGGGSAGHIVPNLAIADELKQSGVSCEYLGRPYGMEYDMVTAAGIPFLKMNSGRLHRSFSMDTLLTPFRVIQGTFQAVRWIRKRRPGAIFCKGGFMSLPLAAAGWLTHTPTVLHESDLTPGLANKLCGPFAKKICCTFEQTMRYLPEDKAVYTGTPIRAALLEGSREKGLALTGLQDPANPANLANPADPANPAEGSAKPIMMVVGGSLGAGVLNAIVAENLEELLGRFQIIHLYGVDEEKEPTAREGYFPIKYAGDELPDLFAITDLVLSRAGANAINEFLMLKLPNILVPLPVGVSRGDQVLNAKQFASQGFSYLLEQENMDHDSLMEALDYVSTHRKDYIAAMSSDKAKNGTKELAKVILSVIK